MQPQHNVQAQSATEAVMSAPAPTRPTAEPPNFPENDFDLGVDILALLEDGSDLPQALGSPSASSTAEDNASNRSSPAPSFMPDLTSSPPTLRPINPTLPSPVNAETMGGQSSSNLLAIPLENQTAFVFQPLQIQGMDHDLGKLFPDLCTCLLPSADESSQSNATTHTTSNSTMSAEPAQENTPLHSVRSPNREHHDHGMDRLIQGSEVPGPPKVEHQMRMSPEADPVRTQQSQPAAQPASKSASASKPPVIPPVQSKPPRSRKSAKSTSPPPPPPKSSSSSTSTTASSSKEAQSSDNKKRIIEEPSFCHKCKDPVATLLLHADGSRCSKACKKREDSTAPTSASGHSTLRYVVDVLCHKCGDPNADIPTTSTSCSDNSSQKCESSLNPNSSDADCAPCSQAKRKRGPAADNEMICQVCKRLVGYGGLRPLHTACSVHAHGDESEQKALGLGEGGFGRSSVDKASLEFAGHRVEVVCAPCRVKYKFCTECGGGGKYRTGKYRPQQLFPKGRRTCILSHVRVGLSPVEVDVFHAPTEISTELITSMKEVHQDGFFGLYAVPEIMEAPCSQLTTFERLNHWMDQGWGSTEQVLRTDVEESRGVRRFLAVAHIEKPTGKARRGRSGSLKLGKDSSSSGGLSSGSSRKKQLIAAEQSSSDGGNTPSKTFFAGRIHVAYALGEWDKQKGTLLITNGYVRTTTISNFGILRKLDEALLVRVQQEVRQSQGRYTPVQTLWMPVRKEHVRLQAYIEKLGFSPAAESVLNFANAIGNANENANGVGVGVSKGLRSQKRSQGQGQGQSFDVDTDHFPQELFRIYSATIDDFMRAGDEDRLKSTWSRG
ncbi:hypothetical protein HK102_008925 [Quaeritorhiza haematococci]|nr:hypothetical protein HK102_008925 [Quaeritorhiza haematococci]